MKRVWGHSLAGLLLLCGAAGVFPGCVHDDSTIFVRDVLAPKTGTTSADCAFSNDPGQTFISSGSLDVSIKNHLEYDGNFLVGNQLVPESNQSQLQTETSTVTLQGAIVRITTADGTELKRFTRLTSTTISPATGASPGYAPAFVEIVDPGTATGMDPPNAELQALSAATPGALGNPVVRLVTYTRFFGVTLGGKSVESNEFEFPVDVCNGCRVLFTNVRSRNSPNCVPNASATTTTQPVVPCQIGQDLNVDCTLVCGVIPACAANTN